MALNLKINADTRQAQSSVRGLSGVLRTGLGTALGFITAQAIPRMIGAIGDLVKRTSEVNAITTGFQGLSKAAGLSADTMLTMLGPATQGLISDFELMKMTNNALALDIISSEEQWADLSEAAIKLGRVVGQDATAALESMTVGIGRQSRQMLDNLGVIVQAQSAYEKYAEKIGVAAKDLTELEKKTAFAEEATRKIILKASEAGDVHLVLGDRVTIAKNKMGNWIDKVILAVGKNENLMTGIDNLTTSLSGNKDMIGEVEGAIDEITSALGDLLSALSLIIDTYNGLREIFQEGKEKWLPEQNESFLELIDTFGVYAWWMEKVGDGVDFVRGRHKDLEDQQDKTGRSTFDLIRQVRGLEKETRTLVRTLDDEEDAFKEVTRAKGTYDGLVDSNIPKARDLTWVLDELTGAVEGEADAFRDVTDAKSGYDGLVDSNIPKAKDMTKLFEELTGTVAGKDGESLAEAFGSAEDAFGGFIDGLIAGRDPIDILKGLLIDLFKTLLKWLLSLIPIMQYFIMLLGAMGVRTGTPGGGGPGWQPYTPIVVMGNPALAGAGGGPGAAGDPSPVSVPLVVDHASVRTFADKVSRELRDRMSRNVNWA